MRRDVFDGLVVAHAVLAVVGFGAIALTGVYGAQARRLRRPGAREEVQRYFARPPLAEGAILLVGIVGYVALGVDPAHPGPSQLWTVIGAVLWLVSCSLWLRIVRPAELAIRTALAATGGGAVAGDEGRALAGQALRLQRAAAASSVLFVVALGFMVFQPS